MDKLKAHIIAEIESLNNPNMLREVSDFLTSLRKNTPHPENNKDAVLGLAGTISPEDADEMQEIIQKEFSKIEGEW